MESEIAFSLRKALVKAKLPASDAEQFVSSMEGHVAITIDQVLSKLDARFDKIDSRLDAIEARMDAQFKSIDERFKAVDHRFQTWIWVFSVVGGLVVLSNLLRIIL